MSNLSLASCKLDSKMNDLKKKIEDAIRKVRYGGIILQLHEKKYMHLKDFIKPSKVKFDGDMKGIIRKELKSEYNDFDNDYISKINGKIDEIRSLIRSISLEQNLDNNNHCLLFEENRKSKKLNEDVELMYWPLLKIIVIKEHLLN